jgi:peptide-methionine (S)-S-oxide reductase
MKIVHIIISFFILAYLSQDIYAQNNKKMELATFGSGCFWCSEAIFEKVNGVESVVSGYSGGKVKNPTYKEVCTGNTGHAEVVQITYNPKIITFKDLLEIFWKMHDPTTLNRQGADIGTQYRSVIFYHTDKQKEIAETYKKKLNEANIYKNPVVTEISPFESFYKGEDYHQEYYENNKAQPYCSFVITPKLEKFKKVFKEKLK